MEKNDKNDKKKRNSHINSYTSSTKDIIGISLTGIFPFSSIFAIETLID